MSPKAINEFPGRVLSPSELVAERGQHFPDEVFVAVNGLIAERLEGQYADITLKALANRMVKLGLKRADIRKNNWDQVGSIYKSAGWDVKYYSPHPALLA